MKNKDQVQNMLAERYNRRPIHVTDALVNRAEIKLLEEVLRDGDEKQTAPAANSDDRNFVITSPEWEPRANIY